MKKRFLAKALMLLGLMLAAGLVCGCREKPSVDDIKMAVETDMENNASESDTAGDAQISPPLHWRRSIKNAEGDITEIRYLKFGKYDETRDCWPIKISVTRVVKEVHKPVLWPKVRQEEYDLHTITPGKPWERCIGQDDSGRWVVK
jgi:hypothetical protein